MGYWAAHVEDGSMKQYGGERGKILGVDLLFFLLVFLLCSGGFCAVADGGGD